MSDTLFILLRFALILPAIILHEVAHGYVAYLLGDTTARDSGRLTLNPVAHIDLWGTILMPAMLLFLSGGRFAFGYAKPVPIDPRRMTKVPMRTGLLLTGIAGPAANLVMAAVAAILCRLTLSFAPEIVVLMLAYFVYLNLLLMFFNLIPIPPLDGSRVVQRFLKGDALRWYFNLERYGFIIVIALIVFLPQVTGFDPITAYFRVTLDPAARLLLGSNIAGVLGL